jgi:hypothetical protein
MTITNPSNHAAMMRAPQTRGNLLLVRCRLIAQGIQYCTFPDRSQAAGHLTPALAASILHVRFFDVRSLLILGKVMQYLFSSGRSGRSILAQADVPSAAKPVAFFT